MIGEEYEKKGRWLMALLLSLFFVACTPTDKVLFDTTLPENENNTQGDFE